MVLFVNLPLFYLAAHPGAVERLAARGLRPELGLDATSLDQRPESWHVATARRLEAAGLRAGVHLPFNDLKPASADPLILAASRERLARARDIARIYAPLHLVGHPSLSPPTPGDSAKALRERCRETWLRFLEGWPDHPPLHLENTFDTDPEELAALISSLSGENCDVCFDVGHWHSFAGGARRQDLTRWLNVLGPHIGHLHLHDNDGGQDAHLGLGAGHIPFAVLFERLSALGLRPTATLEPHTEEALAHSLDYIARHPELFTKISA